MNNPALQRRLPNSLLFDDVDQLHEASPGWELEFRQLGRGLLGAQMSRVNIRSLDIVHLRLNNAVLQRAATPLQSRTFTIIDPSCLDFQWCGQQVNANQVLVFDPEGGFESITPVGFNACAMSFGNTLIESVIEKLHAPDSILNISAASTLDSVSQYELQQFRLYLASCTNALFNLTSKENQSEQVLAHMEQNLCEEFVTLLMDPQANLGQGTFHHRTGVLNKAIAYIRDTADQAITVADVCQAAQVNPRTLQRVFREHLGITPRACIKKTRLDGVRQALQAAAPPVDVHKLAGQWGFWHMGDFARDYRQEYGELPSKTLNGH